MPTIHKKLLTILTKTYKKTIDTISKPYPYTQYKADSKTIKEIYQELNTKEYKTLNDEAWRKSTESLNLLYNNHKKALYIHYFSYI